MKCPPESRVFPSISNPSFQAQCKTYMCMMMEFLNNKQKQGVRNSSGVFTHIQLFFSACSQMGKPVSSV